MKNTFIVIYLVSRCHQPKKINPTPKQCPPTTKYRWITLVFNVFRCKHDWKRCNCEGFYAIVGVCVAVRWARHCRTTSRRSVFDARLHSFCSAGIVFWSLNTRKYCVILVVLFVLLARFWCWTFVIHADCSTLSRNKSVQNQKSVQCLKNHLCRIEFVNIAYWNAQRFERKSCITSTHTHTQYISIFI